MDKSKDLLDNLKQEIMKKYIDKNYNLIIPVNTIKNGGILHKWLKHEFTGIIKL